MKRQTNLKALGIILWLMALCTTAQAQVTADFTSNMTTACGLPVTIQFTDLSIAAPGDSVRPVQWSFGTGVNMGGVPTPSFTYTQPGVYTVRLIVRSFYTNLRDTIIKTAYIDLSGALYLTSTNTNATCPNCPDGSIALNMTGGVTPYSFRWNNASTQATATGLVPGRYSVTR